MIIIIRKSLPNRIWPSNRAGDRQRSVALTGRNRVGKGKSERMTGKLAHTIKWGVFLVSASLLTGRIVILGMANYYADQDNPQADNTALAWYAHQPGALVRQACALLKTAPVKAEQLLHQAVQDNPAEARSYLTLANLRQEQGDSQQATALLTIASDLAPMRSTLQLQVADFWLRQGQLRKALEHVSVVLRLRPALAASLYPMLLRLAEDPRMRPVVAVLYHKPPEWWADFFSYAAANASSLDTVRALYQGQLQNGGKPDVTQQHAYLARLQQEGQWVELYFNWLNSLDTAALKALGNLYNGDFELPFSEQGFDWRAPKVKGVLVETAPTYGMSGNKALHVVFQGQRVPFSHLYQYLLLNPGRYRLRGKVRPDGLRTERGIQWNLSCIASEAKPLGSSERFLGSDDQWRQFVVEFVVPAKSCQVQLLQLVLLGRAALDFEANGAVWFDSMAIERVD